MSPPPQPPGPEHIEHPAMSPGSSAVTDQSEPTRPGGTGMWEAPIPLDESRALPAFPVDALPTWVAEMTTAVAEFTQTPPDLAGTVALAAISTAVGGRSVVLVRPGYIEPTNLFLICALPPGSRKSDVFKPVTRPVWTVQAELQEAAAPRITQAEIARKIALREAEDAERQATTDDPTTVTDATDAALRVQEIRVPPKPKLLADDITPEKAKSLIVDQGGRLAVLAPEGGIVSMIAGRYSGQPDFDVFLRGHAGEPLDVERQHREAQSVEHAYLTLGLVVQPVVLRNLAGIPDAREKGLLGRFLYSLPTPTVGYREVRGAPPIPDVVAAAYDTRLRQLVLHYHPLPKPAQFVFSHDADEAMYDLQAEVEPHLRPGGTYSHMTDWAGKYPGATARLTGILHAATHLESAATTEITAATFAQGRRLGEYFLAHALATYDHMRTDSVLEDARTILDWIQRTRPTRFNRRDVLNTHRRRFAKATDIDPALQVLEDRGHVLRTEPNQRTGPGRKPLPDYWPHPQYRSQQDRA